MMKMRFYKEFWTKDEINNSKAIEITVKIMAVNIAVNVEDFEVIENTTKKGILYNNDITFIRIVYKAKYSNYE